MLASVSLLVLASALYSFYSTVSNLRANIERAKQSGLPYYISPLHPLSPVAQLTNKLWLRAFKLLPRKYWEKQLPVLNANWHYRDNHKPFEALGTSFIIVSPGRLMLYTDDAQVIHQVTSKREAFPKDTAAYSLLSQYGHNVLTTEGQLWRMHRRITSASFNEKNAALVWRESVKQTFGLINQWLGADGQGNKTIKTVEQDTMALTLNIIMYAGFGVKMFWPGESLPAGTDARLAKYASLDAPEQHTMSFKDSLAYTLHHILFLLLTPKWARRALPMKNAKFADDAEKNYLQFMQEFLKDKIEDVRRHDKEEGMDIMGSLVKTSYGEKAANGSAKTSGKTMQLTDPEIIGNAFIMIVAGHETTANVMHFTVLELAANPDAQRKLQADVDRLLGKSDPSTWDFEENVNPLSASMVAAVVNETLRLLPPVVVVPKIVSPGQDQPVHVDGKTYMVPQGTQVSVTIVAVHRNPRYWPTKPSKLTDAETDIDDFVPERWFQTGTLGDTGPGEVEGADTEDFGGFSGPDTSAQLYRPPRGAYLPFSDGARSCLGRRIAQAELLAAVSVIFQNYSVELAVDEWASDEEVAAMSREERAKVYKKAQDKARATILKASSMLTLKLHGNDHVPIRLVRRGEERFVNFVDASI
ncbi:cytochrome P450 [Microdochium trichocladiopsis]|uniref:Cytochrome P450 n=1 Tax=Microdochium trichocladiopsis TaxID=1682393 RepID=A0A9P8Y002_9PEZI|nr:cytochrome P450 [Microdochium trichocladiopsis]KAH7026000.1 cytochrome P450 [Microdochium trichocladiopsis]